MHPKDSPVHWPTKKTPGTATPQTVGVVTLGAPEAARHGEAFERGLETLRGMGYRTQIAPHARLDHGFLADGPARLAEDLNALVADPSIDWIICTGGGYNANAVLPHVDFAGATVNPKPIVGLSNMTVILNALASRSNVVTYHGPAVVWDLGREGGVDPFTLDALTRALAAGSDGYALESEDSWTWLRGGTADGRLVGGNMWSLQQLIGTQHSPQWGGAILFLEDCFCELHQVQAMVDHFVQAGVMSDIAGLVIGIPEGCAESELEPAPDFNDILASAVQRLGVPVVAGVSLGHTVRKATLPIGSVCHIDSNANRISFS